MFNSVSGRIHLVFLVLLTLCSCSGTGGELVPIQKERSGDYVVTLLGESTELAQDVNHLVLEFRDASTNELTAVDNLQIQASMPMAGMAPMFGEVSSPTADAVGRYEFTAELTMIGGWRLVVAFDPAEEIQFNVNAY